VSLILTSASLASVDKGKLRCLCYNIKLPLPGIVVCYNHIGEKVTIFIGDTDIDLGSSPIFPQTQQWLRKAIYMEPSRLNSLPSMPLNLASALPHLFQTTLLVDILLHLHLPTVDTLHILQQPHHTKVSLGETSLIRRIFPPERLARELIRPAILQNESTGSITG